MNLSVIPNSITLLNLFVGIIAVILLIENSLDVSDIFILTLICIFLDYLDGFIARLLKVQSKFGSNLDSLADIISFGFVPGIIIYNMLKETHSDSIGSILSSLIPFLGFIITLSSAFRLARFSTENKNDGFFRGLPTPANTIMIYSIAIIGSSDNFFSKMIMNYNFLILLSIIISLLLVSRIKLINFKFLDFSLSRLNKIRYLLIILFIVLLLFLKTNAIPFAMILYILSSLIYSRI